MAAAIIGIGAGLAVTLIPLVGSMAAAVWILRDAPPLTKAEMDALVGRPHVAQRS